MPRPKTKFEEWQSMPEASKWLREILDGPMGKFFLSVLEERHPLRLNVNMPPAYLTANGAAVSATVAGYEQALRNIRELQDSDATPLKPLVETYGVDSPAQATE